MTDLQSQNYIIEGIEEHEFSNLDSLPYIDPYDENDQMKAIALIEEELSKGDIKVAEEVTVNFNVCLFNKLSYYVNNKN